MLGRMLCMRNTNDAIASRRRHQTIYNCDLTTYMNLARSYYLWLRVVAGVDRVQTSVRNNILTIELVSYEVRVIFVLYQIVKTRTSSKI